MELVGFTMRGCRALGAAVHALDVQFGIPAKFKGADHMPANRKRKRWVNRQIRWRNPRKSVAAGDAFLAVFAAWADETLDQIGAHAQGVRLGVPHPHFAP